MSLFQKAPATAEEVAACRPLDIPPDQVLEMDESEWYARIYRGDSIPQLTVRAVVVGSVLGFFLAFTNLYIGLKTGWALGVAITACIVAYALWGFFHKIGLAKTQLTILETNCMQSTASAAGYATGGTMVSAIAALLMLSASEANPKGQHLPWYVLAGWTLLLGLFGTLLAIPMKRNMINQEKLRFPSGTAAAVTLQSLYSEGTAAVRKARALMYAAIAGAAFPIVLEFLWFRDKIFALAADSPIFDFLPGGGTHVVDGVTKSYKPSDWTVVLDHNPVMIAAGLIVGLRISIYMLFSGLVLAFYVGPEAYDTLWTSPSGEVVRAVTSPGKAWKEVGLWLGVPIMVSYGLLSFAMQWRTIARAFKGLISRSENTDENANLVKATEVPTSWFAIGSLICGSGIVVLADLYFHVPLLYGVIAILMTFFLALVACRATGESDITPTGAMGKIMQLTYGVMIPQSTTANLMTASITASSAGSSADLLTDLKSGYLLGANPRRQFMAQFLGVFTGTAATVIGFYLLVPDATVLNSATSEYPAPSAQAWKAVAELFRLGIENMHPMHRTAIFGGLILGAVMLALETFLPKAKAWLPSATGIGLGLILPFQYPLSMLIGAAIGYFWTKRNKQHSDDYMVPCAAGVIAGLSIMGVLVALLNKVTGYL